MEANPRELWGLPPTIPTMADIFNNPTALATWLVVVAAARAFSVFLGWFVPEKLRLGLFAGVKPEAVTGVEFRLAARLMSIWTLTTCMMCLVAASNLDNPALLAATAATFAIAILFLAIELTAGTVTPLTVITPFFFASASARAPPVVDDGSVAPPPHAGSPASHGHSCRLADCRALCRPC